MKRRGRARALRRRYGGRCPKGSVVQSLLVPRDRFSKRQAIGWARRHGFNATKVDTTASYYRLRQEAPSHFGRMRTKTLGKGIKAVVGWKGCA